MDTPLYNIYIGRSVRYATLGCKLNFAETSTLRDRLCTMGAHDAADGAQADICIVNTCSVTGEADHKCRQVIHRLVRENPDTLLVVMGCYAQLEGEKIAGFPGVGLVIGMERKGDAPRLIAEALERHCGAPDERDQHEAHIGPTRDIRSFVPSCSRGDRTRYFLKVQDGCNNYCTYCTIPFARGRSRNGTIASLVEQAEDVAAQGGREIVLTGVNIGDFGRTTGESFLSLIQALDGVEGIERYRISSLEPDLLTDDIIAWCADSRAFMPHFHIPLQCGSDTVLRLMHRHYDTALFRSRIERIMHLMPDAFIGVDVMVGTRGETEECFEESYEFIRSLDIAQLHVFSYSERPGTKALEIPHIVSPQEKRARSKRLHELSEMKRQAFYRRFIGTQRPVLWEHAKAGRLLHGFTDNYIRVELSKEQYAEDNSVSIVTLGTPNADCSALTAE